MANRRISGVVFWHMVDFQGLSRVARLSFSAALTRCNTDMDTIIDFLLKAAPYAIIAVLVALAVLAGWGHRSRERDRPQQMEQFAREAGLTAGTHPSVEVVGALSTFSLFQRGNVNEWFVDIRHVLEATVDGTQLTIFDYYTDRNRPNRDDSNSTYQATMLMAISPQVLAHNLTMVPSAGLGNRLKTYLKLGNRVATAGKSSVYSELPNVHVPPELLSILPEEPRLFVEVRQHIMLVRFDRLAGASFQLNDGAGDDRVCMDDLEELHRFYRAGQTLVRVLQRNQNLQNK